jgi:UDP-glucose 4-epimerase
MVDLVDLERKGRRFLITGGAGFIGSHLAERLLDEHPANEVVALDNLSTGRLDNVESIQADERFTFVQGSILDQVLADELVRGVDFVIHLAAAVGVTLIMDEPLRSFITNIRGTEIYIDAAHRYRRPILVASTSEVYGKNCKSPMAETSDRLLGPITSTRWSYSVSKSVDEILAYAYYHERGLPTVVVRLFNTVGPRQSPAYGMVVPRLVRQALAGEPLTVYGDGQQSRCFAHVYDVVDAITRLLSYPGAFGEVFNVGSSEEVSIDRLARLIVERTDSSSKIDLIPYEAVFSEGFEDMRRRIPNTSKLQAAVGWRPTRSLVEIIDDVVAEAGAREPLVK